MTCLSDIRRALRRIGYLKLDDEPTVAEATNGLEALQSLYYDLIDSGADLADVRISAAYEAGENERIFNTTGGNLTVTPPTYITDTSLTPDSDGNQRRPPKEFAVLSIAGATRQTYVYDPYIGDWVEIEALALSDTSPWSTQLGDGLTAMLAVRMAEELGAFRDGRAITVPATVMEAAANARQRVIGRMQQSAGSVFFQPDRRWV